MTERHHVALDRGWALWKWFLVRGAGFSARDVLQLGAQGSLSLERELAQHESAARQARDAAIATLGDRVRAAAGTERKELDKILRSLQAANVARAAELDAGRHAEVTAAATTDAEWRDLLARFDAAFARDGNATSEELRRIAAAPRFREAIAWQNRAAIQTAIAPLLRHTGASNSKLRQKEHLVASYLQRYAVKNDTIGFFGPIAWGQFVPPDRARIEPGRDVIASHRVYFEQWPIAALAARLSEDSDLLVHAAPRRRGTIRLEGEVLHLGPGKTQTLPPIYAAVLAACDGTASAATIAQRVLSEHADTVEDEHDVYALLEQLASSGLIVWAHEVPGGILDPEERLQAALARASSDEPALQFLRTLPAYRARLGEAYGDPSRVEAALDELEAAFVAVAGTDVTRREGQMYAGRTLAYLECTRATDVQLSTALAQQMAAPLSQILQSARWYTHEIARRMRAELDRTYDELVRDGQSAVIDLAAFYDRFGARHAEVFDAVVGEVLASVQDRWDALLACAPGERRVTRASAELDAAVNTQFSAPGPGWPLARFHSPDIMVDAASVDAVLRGEALCVLGELHAGVITPVRGIDLELCPARDELIAGYELDIGTRRVEPAIPQELAHHVAMRSPSPRDHEIELGVALGCRPRSNVLAAGDLVVERRPGSTLVVRSRDGRFELDAIAFFEYDLWHDSCHRFSPIRTRDHRPRITVDQLVIAREQWRMAPSDVSFIALDRGPAQFADARRFMRQHGMPRWMFAKIPEETKPTFIDFESPIYVEMFAKIARKASIITLTEMLPDLGNLWLPDADGARYTSELRVVAVDPVPWRPAKASDV